MRRRRRGKKIYKEYRVIYSEDTRNPSLKGQGMYFKHRRIKLNLPLLAMPGAFQLIQFSIRVAALIKSCFPIPSPP